MFKLNTVFILGAGASCHYGYPSGEELVKEVISLARHAVTYFESARKEGGFAFEKRPLIVKRDSSEQMSINEIELRAVALEFQALLGRLTAVHPLVIDYFLDHNPDLEVVGKFCIAWALLNAEDKYRSRHLDKLNDENWYRFIIHKLTTGCPDKETFLQNRVSFITFNYNISLEYELNRGLSALRRFSDHGSIEKFLTGRIKHVYGRIRQKPFLPPEPFDLAIVPAGNDKPPDYWKKTNTLLDRVYEASQDLNVISPGKAADPTQEIYIARTIISQATCVYILGYGFDRLNSELLELPEHLNLARNQKVVMFTNLDNSGVINKNAARLLGTSANELLPEGGRMIGVGPGRLEKSVRKVYGALARDFDAPEETGFN